MYVIDLSRTDRSPAPLLALQSYPAKLGTCKAASARTQRLYITTYNHPAVDEQESHMRQLLSARQKLSFIARFARGDVKFQLTSRRCR
jgi:hypothetical protein